MCFHKALVKKELLFRTVLLLIATVFVLSAHTNVRLPNILPPNMSTESKVLLILRHSHTDTYPRGAPFETRSGKQSKATEILSVPSPPRKMPGKITRVCSLGHCGRREVNHQIWYRQ